MLKGFKAFIMRGNVVSLAVAFVMGAAFSAIVTALVQDIIMPLITAIFGKQDYSKLFVTLHHSNIMYGSFITAVISFLSIAVGVYFLIVYPMNMYQARMKARKGIPDEAPEVTEIDLLTQIRDALTAPRQ